MSCDEIKIIEETNEITVINNQDKIDVVNNENVTNVIDNEDVVEVTDEVGEKIFINATDVILSTVQSIDVDMGCTATEQVGDVVYVFSDGQVRQANNSSIGTAKVMGFIISKTGDTNCKVRVAGTIDEFVGLNVGDQYFLSSTSGDITDSPPTTTDSVIVRLGQAIKADLFLIEINNDYIIRNSG